MNAEQFLIDRTFELDAHVVKLAGRLRMIDDALERASGALEGGLEAIRAIDVRYISDQIDRAIEWVIDAKVLAMVVLEGLEARGK